MHLGKSVKRWSTECQSSLLSTRGISFLVEAVGRRLQDILAVQAITDPKLMVNTECGEGLHLIDVISLILFQSGTLAQLQTAEERRVQLKKNQMYYIYIYLYSSEVTRECLNACAPCSSPHICYLLGIRVVPLQDGINCLPQIFQINTQ